jgi:hypothetical protein
MLFERFASLDFYYNEVNKISFNICPSLYKFRIKPFEQVIQSASEDMRINRVFEVEEHMGSNFMEQLAIMQYDSLK